MAHPKETRRRNGHLWHLEDKGLKRCAAESLQHHLQRTEGKRATKNPTKIGWQVWWASKR